MIKFSTDSNTNDDELFAAVMAAVNAFLETESSSVVAQSPKRFGAWKSAVRPIGQGAHLNSRIGWSGRDR